MSLSAPAAIDATAAAAKLPSISMTPRLAAAQQRARQLQARAGSEGRDEAASKGRNGSFVAAEYVFVGREAAREPTPGHAYIPSRKLSGTVEGSPNGSQVNRDPSGSGRLSSQDLLRRNHRIIASARGRVASAPGSTKDSSITPRGSMRPCGPCATWALETLHFWNTGGGG